MDAIAEALPEGLTEPKDMVKGYEVNTPAEVILENVRSSIRRQLPQFDGHPDRPGEICIIGGGWSLDETLPELLDICWNRGAPIVALNGAGKWLLERNLRAGALMVLDARPENKRFVEVEIPGCRYLIASQCAPETFDACKGDVWIYHVAETGSAVEAELNDYYQKRWVNVIGGSTVGLRAITLARMMGYRFIHLFGMDSCYSPEGKHHAYPQDLNDKEGSTRMFLAMHKDEKVKGREFRCSVWQASQAQNFRDFLAKNGKHFRLHIHGDGLLAYMLKTGAELRED